MMKAVFFFLASICLINASFIDFPLEDKETKFGELENVDNDFVIEGKPGELIIPYPKPKPTVLPPFITTSRKPEYTTDFVWTTPSAPPSPTTTSRPTPTASTTTPRPTPPNRPPQPLPPNRPPQPDMNNVQIYNNAVLSLRPFAGKLVNVVLNRGENQKTVQENKILYNLRFLRPNQRYFEGVEN